MSCRVAMLRMHRDRLIPLPAPRRRHSNGTLHRRRTPQAEPELPIIARVDELPALQVRPLADQREAQLWREYVDRYHYLGYTPLPGAQMRYLVTSQRRVLAVVALAPAPGRRLPATASSAGALPNAKQPPAVGREQRPLPDRPGCRCAISLPRCWLAAAAGCPRLAGSLRLPTAPAGDLRAVRPLRRYQLPRRQLDPRRTDPRPRQTGRASYPRAAQERHLALPAQARLPPPTLRSSGSSSPPVDRTFTFVSKYSVRGTGWTRPDRAKQRF